MGKAGDGSEALLRELAGLRSAGDGKTNREGRAVSSFLGSQHFMLILHGHAFWRSHCSPHYIYGETEA